MLDRLRSELIAAIVIPVGEVIILSSLSSRYRSASIMSHAPLGRTDRNGLRKI